MELDDATVEYASDMGNIRHLSTASYVWNVGIVRSKGSQIAALAAAIYVLGTPLFAQTNEDWALCLGRDFASPDLPIKGCTAVIQTGRQVLRNLATAYNNRGVAYRLEAKYEEAIRDFDEAIRLVPDDAHAFNNRGVAYRNMGNLDRAVADYDRAISIKSDFKAAYYNRGLARSRGQT